MSSHLELPIEWHLAQVFHIFTYLNKHHNSALVFDPSYPDVNIDTFPKHDWTNFGSKFMATKLACEYIRGFQYKLRMMGIPFSDPCFVYGDSKSVLYNTTLSESTLKKKSSSITYHAVIEGFSTGEWLNRYDPTDTNVSDLLTKPVAGGKRMNRLIQGVMHYI